MLAPLLRLRDPLVHPKVPVHVRRLAPPPGLVRREAPAALRARRAQVVVQLRDQFGSESILCRISHCFLSTIISSPFVIITLHDYQIIQPRKKQKKSEKRKETYRLRLNG